MQFFDIENIFFTTLGYEMSYLEFFGTIAGAVAIWLSAKAIVWSWPIGIINVVLFFFLFYQVQLYPDMFLQVFFFVDHEKRCDDTHDSNKGVEVGKCAWLGKNFGKDLMNVFRECTKQKRSEKTNDK